MSYKFTYLLTFLFVTSAYASLDDRPQCTEEDYVAYQGDTRISKDEYASLEQWLNYAYRTRTGASEMAKARQAIAICGACTIDFSRTYARNLDKACYTAVNSYIGELSTQSGWQGRARPLEIPANIPDRAPLTQEEEVNVLGGAAGVAGGAQKVGG